MIRYIYIVSFLICFHVCRAQPVLDWAKAVGGASNDYFFDGLTICADLQKNILVTGQFRGTSDFDPGPGVYTMTAASQGDDLFTLKLDSNGNFQWAKQIAGASAKCAICIATDNAGNCYTRGKFSNQAGFDPPNGPVLTAGGQYDSFICKYDPAGNLVWVKQFTDSDYSCCGNGISAIAVDGMQNIYVSGDFSNVVDFDPGPGVFKMRTVGFNSQITPPDVFICKLNPSGDLRWARQLGGPNAELSRSIAVDAKGNVYTTGGAYGQTDFDPGPLTNIIGQAGVFVSKLDSSGNFVWARHMGSDVTDFGWSLGLDKYSNITISGKFEKPGDYDPGQGVYTLTPVYPWDFFLAKLDVNGNFLWAERTDGATQEIAVNPEGFIYSTGYFSGAKDFDPGPGNYFLASHGSADIFVREFDPSGNFLCALDAGGVCSDHGRGVACVPGGFYVSGEFSCLADFCPTGTGCVLTGAGAEDIFIAKFKPCDLSSTVAEFPGEELLVSPNPTHGLFTLSGIPENSEIHIYNSLGMLVHSSTCAESLIVIDLIGRPKGIYFVELNSEKDRHCQKIIIE